jgi:hypothetical protein
MHLQDNMTLISVQQHNGTVASAACSPEILIVASPVNKSFTLDFWSTYG